MAIKPSAAVAAAALASLALASAAQAELQTWRLTATTYEVSEGFTAPAFAEIGKAFTVDYVIDTQVPAFDGWPGLFEGAVKSLTIGGVTSEAGGYVIADDSGLNGINAWPSDPRSNGIDFISFYNAGESSSADVASTLKLLSTFASSYLTVLRVDFGDNSVHASPTSFVMTSSVPEPSAAWLLLVGLPALALKRSRRTAAA
jgi:hypothetical protein